MGKTKIIIIIVLVVVIAGAGVFYFYTQDKKNESLENEFVPMAEDYFENYMSANTGSNIYEVTLDDLKKANENDADYDLSKFDNCNNDSLAKITIDYNTGKVTKTEVELNCK